MSEDVQGRILSLRLELQAEHGQRGCFIIYLIEGNEVSQSVILISCECIGGEMGRGGRGMGMGSAKIPREYFFN